MTYLLFFKLKVNFRTSLLVEVNVNQSWPRKTIFVLKYKIEFFIQIFGFSIVEIDEGDYFENLLLLRLITDYPTRKVTIYFIEDRLIILMLAQWNPPRIFSSYQFKNEWTSLWLASNLNGLYALLFIDC